jgi:hypothetical protein
MRRRQENAMAKALGLFSLALGIHQVLRPRDWTRGLGTRNRTNVVRSLFGAREIAAGAALLTGSNPAPWFAARAAGDLLDIATLGRVLVSPNGRKRNAALALAAVVGITLLDLAAAKAARSR